MPHVKLRDGAELYYESRGAGPALFLVPGLGGDGRFWDPNVEGLAKHFTVVVHDHRGTGRSTLSRIGYSVAQMADDASSSWIPWATPRSIGVVIRPVARWGRCWPLNNPVASIVWC